MNKDLYVPNVEMIEYNDWITRVINCDIVHKYK